MSSLKGEGVGYAGPMSSARNWVSRSHAHGGNDVKCHKLILLHLMFCFCAAEISKI